MTWARLMATPLVARMSAHSRSRKAICQLGRQLLVGGTGAFERCKDHLADAPGTSACGTRSL
jgi:hypothetical protein